jgi:hypothetical protein
MLTNLNSFVKKFLEFFLVQILDYREVLAVFLLITFSDCVTKNAISRKADLREENITYKLVIVSKKKGGGVVCP